MSKKKKNNWLNRPSNVPKIPLRTSPLSFLLPKKENETDETEGSGLTQKLSPGGMIPLGKIKGKFDPEILPVDQSALPWSSNEPFKPSQELISYRGSIVNRDLKKYLIQAYQAGLQPSTQTREEGRVKIEEALQRVEEPLFDPLDPVNSTCPPDWITYRDGHEFKLMSDIFAHGKTINAYRDRAEVKRVWTVGQHDLGIQGTEATLCCTHLKNQSVGTFHLKFVQSEPVACSSDYYIINRSLPTLGLGTEAIQKLLKVCIQTQAFFDYPITVLDKNRTVFIRMLARLNKEMNDYSLLTFVEAEFGIFPEGSKISIPLNIGTFPMEYTPSLGLILSSYVSSVRALLDLDLGFSIQCYSCAIHFEDADEVIGDEHLIYLLPAYGLCPNCINHDSGESFIESTTPPPF